MVFSRLLYLIFLSFLIGAVAFAGSDAVFAADEGASQRTWSFKEIYDAALVMSDIGYDVAAQADQAARENKYIDASAKYLAAATKPFTSGSFERARPNLDKAFFIASKMPVAYQKEMLSTLSKIVGKTYNIHDYDIYKYLAQQRLRLIEKQPGSTAEDRYSEIQTLAISCSGHQRYKEAEALLIQTLQDLQSMKPVSQDVGWCESTLARVYEESGDLDNAKQYYSRWAQFARDIHNSDQLTRALQEYTNFLIKHKMGKEAVPVAEDYFKQATSREQAPWRDRVSFGLIARGLADVDVNEADKYYRAAFENEKAMTAHAMNAGYGQTICEWAEMLNKCGRTDEAISVLNEGMAFCRSSKWPNALDTYMPQMVDKYEQVLRGAGRKADADYLHASFVKEMASHKETLTLAKERELLDAVNNPNATPSQKVSALTETAYRSFDANKCDEAIKYLEQAVKIYESNATSPLNPRMYGCFLDVGLRLSKCGSAQDSKPMLLRIVKARMVYGFPDPATIGYESHCGGRTPADPFDELFAHPSIGGWQIDTAQEALLKQLLEEAKAAGRIPTVVYFLTRLTESQRLDQGRVASLEEVEIWRAKENDVDVLLISMMQTADMYMFLKQYDKMMDKCKAAIAIAEKSGHSFSVENFANSLMNANELDKAECLFMVDYKRSLHERGDYGVQRLIGDIEKLANKYRDSGNVDSGGKLLEKALDVTRAQLGSDSTLTRAWLMKLSTYCVLADERQEAKKFNQEFIASITKPGMSIAKTTSNDMAVLGNLLKDKGYSADARIIETRLKAFDQEQCSPH